jgi:hypothetical protein
VFGVGEASYYESGGTGQVENKHLEVKICFCPRIYLIYDIPAGFFVYLQYFVFLVRISRFVILTKCKKDVEKES